MTDAYAQAAWYRDRAEPEVEIRGRLVPADEDPGPAGRAALRLRLVTTDRIIPVYDPEGLPVLSELRGRDVVLRGRLVDLRGEGFGVELWIGQIAAR